jgi:hydroxymethylpyrimidine pyrophosphatase-like HAD family hydrolase
MKLLTVALDYDGTLTSNDALSEATRTAVAELRGRGITVLLVTGRRLDDLRRAAGDLHFVDGVVGENGAVLEFPDSGYAATLGPSPPPAFIEALRRQGIAHAVGQVIVEAASNDGARILEVVRALELPLSLIFNRGRVMIVPQSISKATGLQRALTVLRLSPRNAVGIGDAENDHELLAVCEVGVAVAWGSRALQAAADYVLPGDGPSAVPAYLTALARAGRVPTPVRTRRQLLLGHADDGRALALAVRGRNVLVAGDTKSGKSWVAGLLCEQLILYGYCLCIIDPEGDYVSLEALPGVVVYGGNDPLPRPRALLRALRHPDVSVVIDLSHTPHDERLEYMREILPAMATLRRHTGLPHRVILDEAHYFLHHPEIGRLLDLQENGYTLVTYRASLLPADLLAASEAIVVTRASDPSEIDALVRLCGCGDREAAEQWTGMLGGLVIGEAVVLPITAEAGGVPRRIRLVPRLTPHVRHLTKYIDVPVAGRRAFVFWRNGIPSGARAHTLREFVAEIEGAPPSALDGHLRRHDVSRWVAEVFGDYPLASTLREIEDGYAAGERDDVAGRMARAVRARYEFIEPVPPLRDSPR